MTRGKPIWELVWSTFGAGAVYVPDIGMPTAFFRFLRLDIDEALTEYARGVIRTTPGPSRPEQSE